MYCLMEICNYRIYSPGGYSAINNSYGYVNEAKLLDQKKALLG